MSDELAGELAQLAEAIGRTEQFVLRTGLERLVKLAKRDHTVKYQLSVGNDLRRERQQQQRQQRARRKQGEAASMEFYQPRRNAQAEPSR